LTAQAAAQLPWDQTLLAFQDMLISIVAPAAIALASPAPSFCMRFEGTTSRLAF
jgi:hypothetical protein